MERKGGRGGVGGSAPVQTLECILANVHLHPTNSSLHPRGRADLSRR